jgi:putative OPT family oligopeptide transporter
MVPVLQILYEAYGIGSAFPRAGMDPTQALAAPKAAIMAVVSQSIFSQSLDWTMFLTGVAIAFMVIAIDQYLKSQPQGWRLPVMAIALGFYMPLDITTSFFFGGLIAHFVNRKMDSKRASLGADFKTKALRANQMGLLFASGLIAGDALTGICLAIPFAAYQSTDLFKINMGEYAYLSTILGTLAFWLLCKKLYNVSTNTK